MQKFGVAAAIAVSYAMLDLVGFDPQKGAAAARELHLLFALQPAASWAVMIGLLLLIRRALARDRALAEQPLAIAAARK